MLAEIFFIIGAYILGSLPVLVWIGKSRGFALDPKAEDLHQALWRRVGYGAGIAGVGWDVIKGPVPPIIAWLLDFDAAFVGLSGLAVTAGQMWPLFSGFYGKERGNTTGLGATLAISPFATLISLVPLAIGGGMRIFSSTRKSDDLTGEGLKFSGVSDSTPLGMLGAFTMLPLAAWGLGQDAEIIWVMAGFWAAIVVRRLTADLGDDLNASPRADMGSILKNRFLYDRSYH